jgi:hypothetical protein
MTRKKNLLVSYLLLARAVCKQLAISLSPFMITGKLSSDRTSSVRSDLSSLADRIQHPKFSGKEWKPDERGPESDCRSWILLVSRSSQPDPDLLRRKHGRLAA